MITEKQITTGCAQIWASCNVRNPVCLSRVLRVDKRLKKVKDEWVKMRLERKWSLNVFWTRSVFFLLLSVENQTCVTDLLTRHTRWRWRSQTQRKKCMFVQKAFINVDFPLWRYSNTITQTMTAGVKNQQQVLLYGCVPAGSEHCPWTQQTNVSEGSERVPKGTFPHSASTLDGGRVQDSSTAPRKLHQRWIFLLSSSHLGFSTCFLLVFVLVNVQTHAAMHNRRVNHRDSLLIPPTHHAFV